MRRTVFHVSLTLLVPLIVAGTAVLALFLSEYLPFFRYDVSGDLTRLATLVGGTTFIVAFLLLYLILRPIRDFLDAARASGVLPAKDSAFPGGLPRSDLEEFRQAFEQVGQALSRLDAKALFPEIVGQSPVLRAVLGQVLKVAPTNASVLLTGESGTGKEIIARAIHEQSLRRDGPLVVVNCAAIPETLLESELFGYEKGAFTGAVTAKPGRFELAHAGTLFLDEIGDMPLAVQAKILRMLETGTVERVGGIKSVRCDVRVVAATNRDIQELMRQGLFREDLFHRLNVFPLHLPPLRERRDDIPALAEHFAASHNGNADISAAALGLLMTHDWPGNVRELRNSLERATVLAGEEEIRPEHLAGLFGNGLFAFPAGNTDGKGKTDNGAGLDQRLASVERTMIEEALARCDGIQAKAARLLGIKERSLWHRIKKLDIAVKQFK
ncbi:regulatory protein, Fis family [Desulfonatronum thiosulfatophilum]|uniref:Regulatory protein, Fis family n=1 Tax=Desulfonatronum thiosulfatophilum TaxID=617002 RepID=A0A1G6CNV1_9BACT|nr:sigma-54 dependent transcriptional regulator [Desulfonatronum thiosulfatophilum]SDB34571.1 regulatory protein, Fis family [Desulfonatronum thiosulfatophilum]